MAAAAPVRPPITSEPVFAPATRLGDAVLIPLPAAKVVMVKLS